MSSSEEENFDINDVSGSDFESDDYAPKKKLAKEAAKPSKPAKPTTKAQAKPKAAPKKKPLKDIDENAMDIDNLVDSDSDGGPSTSKSVPQARHTNKTASETYQQVCCRGVEFWLDI